MRKAIVCITVLLQIAFGVFLIANGGKTERAIQAEIDRILANGTEFLFSLQSFEYNAEDPHAEPITFSLYSAYWDDVYPYYPLTANEQGVAIFGQSVETPPPEPYLAPWVGSSYCAIDKKVLNDLFGADAPDGWHYYSRHWLWPKENRFEINGKRVPVYAVGTVNEGNVVYTGIVVDGVRY